MNVCAFFLLTKYGFKRRRRGLLSPFKMMIMRNCCTNPRPYGRRRQQLFNYILTIVLLTFVLLMFTTMFSLVYEPMKSPQETIDNHRQQSSSLKYFFGQSASIDFATKHQPLYYYHTGDDIRRNSTLYNNRQLSKIIQTNYAGRLLNMDKFHYIHNGSDRCVLKSTTVLSIVIVIHSATNHFEHRQLIRRTWAKWRQPNVQVFYAFIVGIVPPDHKLVNTNIQTKLEQESTRFEDIVQGNFVDNYRNLTIKHLCSLRWTVEYCSDIDFILKIDDDAYIDLHAVVQYLFQLKLNSIDPIKNFMACSLFPKDTSPKRTGKWSLSFESYPYPTFPSYCSGVGYFITPDVAFDLFEAAHHVQVPLIPIDDVFVTGLVASTLDDLKRTSLNRQYVYNSLILRKWLQRNQAQICPTGYLIGDIGTEPDWQQLSIQLWNRTEIAWKQCNS